MAEILDNLTNLVGETPVLRLSRLSAACGCLTRSWQNWNVFPPAEASRTGRLCAWCRVPWTGANSPPAER